MDPVRIVWNPPAQPPENASYVLVKYLDGEGRPICSPAAYENGRFAEIAGTYVFQTGEVLGRSDLPYDGRTQERGT